MTLIVIGNVGFRLLKEFNRHNARKKSTIFVKKQKQPPLHVRFRYTQVDKG